MYYLNNKVQLNQRRKIMTTTTTTISIPAYREKDFLDLVNRYKNKQVKYELPVGSVNEINRYLKKVTHRTHIKGESFADDIVNTFNMEFISYEVSNMNFIQKQDSAEYFHIGTMSKDHKTGVMTVYSADAQYDNYLKVFPSICNHCNSNRQRNTYYVFLKDDKPFYLGSTCAKDIFGFESAEMLKLGTSLFTLIKNDYDDYNYDYSYITFDQILFFVQNNITKTWKDVKQMIIDNELNENSPSTVSNLYNDIVKHYANPKNSFEQNICNVMQNNYCSIKHLVLYACGVYYALKSILKSNNTKKTTCISNYNTGDKIFVNNATVIMKKQFYNNYGYHTSYTYLIKLIAPNGEVFETYSSGDFSNVNLNDIVSFKATVKGQGVFNGNQVWKITRCSKI